MRRINLARHHRISWALPFPAHGDSDTSVKGIDYKFTASIKNTGAKQSWLFNGLTFFFHKIHTTALLTFSRQKLVFRLERKRTYAIKFRRRYSEESRVKSPTEYNRELFKERVVILRLDYADGSSWQSSSRR